MLIYIYIYIARHVPTAAFAALRSLCLDCWQHVGHDMIAYYVALEGSADSLTVEDQVILLEVRPSQNYVQYIYIYIRDDDYGDVMYPMLPF